MCERNYFKTGGPPKWNPQQLPVKLLKDNGLRFIDQNAYRCPAYSFAPLFQALSVTKPNFDFAGVDVVVNRNSLRKLLNFAAGRVPDSFRIDLHMLGNTLFICRKEQKNHEILSPDQFVGYGHSFENAFTLPEIGLEDSLSHHRVIRYVTLPH